MAFLAALFSRQALSTGLKFFGSKLGMSLLLMAAISIGSGYITYKHTHTVSDLRQDISNLEIEKSNLEKKSLKLEIANKANLSTIRSLKNEIKINQELIEVYKEQTNIDSASIRKIIESTKNLKDGSISEHLRYKLDAYDKLFGERSNEESKETEGSSDNFLQRIFGR